MSRSVRDKPPKPVRISKSYTDTRMKQLAAPTFIEVSPPKGSAPTIGASTVHLGGGPVGLVHTSRI